MTTQATSIESRLREVGRAGLEADGIAVDSLDHLLSILKGVQVPATVRGFPSDRLNEQGLVLGSLDLTPPSSTPIFRR